MGAFFNVLVEENTSVERRLLSESVLGGATDPEVVAYGAHVDACRTWGRQERAALGL